MLYPESCHVRNEIIAAAANAPGVADWLTARLSQLMVSYATDAAVPSAAVLSGTTGPSGTKGLSGTKRLSIPPYHVGQRVPPDLVPPAGLTWTLALPKGSGAPMSPASSTRLTVRQADALDTTLLIRPDDYLAASGVPADPHFVLSRLSDYVMTGHAHAGARDQNSIVGPLLSRGQQ
jgi:hypothetical protein